MSGIYTYQSGAVQTWGNVIYLGGDLEWDPRNVDRAFNTAAFNTVPAQQLDRNIRTLPSDFGELRLDAINTLNVALVKNTSARQGRTSPAPRRDVQRLRSGAVLGAGERADQREFRAQSRARPTHRARSSSRSG